MAVPGSSDCHVCYLTFQITVKFDEHLESIFILAVEVKLVFTCLHVKLSCHSNERIKAQGCCKLCVNALAQNLS